MNFIATLNKVRSQNNSDWQPPERLLAIDPGETTGIAFFINGELTKDMQCSINLNKLMPLMQLIKEINPEIVVCENYIVYGSKVRMHAWNKLITPQIIGAIRFICELNKVKFYTQLASTAKGFCNDNKLKEWGYWIKGHEHSRDSIKHGCYFLLFHNEGRLNEFYKRIY